MRLDLSNGGKMAPLTFSLEWDCWHLGLLAIEYEETGKELDRGGPGNHNITTTPHPL